MPAMGWRRDGLGQSTITGTCRRLAVGELGLRQDMIASASGVEGTGKALGTVRIPCKDTVARDPPSSIPRPKPLPLTSSNTASKLPLPLQIPVPNNNSQPCIILPASTLLKKVALFHQTPVSTTSQYTASPPSSTLSISLRNRLDYHLSRFALLAESEAIRDITMKEFLGMLLNTRQLGRMTSPRGKSKVDLSPLSVVQRSGDRDEGELQEVFWQGRKVEGVVMKGIMPELLVDGGRSTKICVYGCQSPEGLHQWLSGTRYVNPDSHCLFLHFPDFI